jgi:hypothetical protein
MNAAKSQAKRMVKSQQCECSVTELAWMANAVYELHENTTIRSNEENMQKLSRAGWSVSECHQQPNFAGSMPKKLAMACFTKGKVMVLSFKGTTPGSASDLTADAMSVVLGSEPVDPFLAGCELLQKYQSQGYTVMVTGHSLGGYMAEVVATSVGISGVGFAAPGSGHHGGDYIDGQCGFQNINFENDACGNIMPGMYAHKQWSVYVQDHGAYTHRMDYMVQSMEKRRDWTNKNAVSKSTSAWTGYYTNK